MKLTKFHAYCSVLQANQRFLSITNMVGKNSYIFEIFWPYFYTIWSYFLKHSCNKLRKQCFSQFLLFSFDTLMPDLIYTTWPNSSENIKKMHTKARSNTHSLARRRRVISIITKNNLFSLCNNRKWNKYSEYFHTHTHNHFNNW